MPQPILLSFPAKFQSARTQLAGKETLSNAFSASCALTHTVTTLSKFHCVCARERERGLREREKRRKNG